jgi:hypothetical protein
VEFGDVKEIHINPRLVEQLSKATIKSIIEAIVELVTNCDDSYRRLEEQGVKRGGRIEISVSREKGGICKELVVKDYAEGMTRSELEKAIEFAGETSGFAAGRSVRGLFGRGLKEAIIALGEGEIITIKNDELNAARVWWENKKPLYCLSRAATGLSPQQREEYGICEGNGTIVTIKVKNEKIKVPECDNLRDQIAGDYALRDITSSPNRDVRLNFHDLKRGLHRHEIPVRFQPPKGELVYNTKVRLPEYGDEVIIRLFESPVKLEAPHLYRYAKAGILVKSEAASLDNQLFRYRNDTAALYFFGEAICPGIAKRIREGDTGIIDANRGGIEWGHQYCHTLQTTIEDVLEPFIEEKRRTLEPHSQREISEHTRKFLRGLRDLLNEIAKMELEEGEHPTGDPGKIDRLTIIPHQANLELNIPRSLSIYAPSSLVRMVGNNRTAVASDNRYIQPLTTSVSLERHKTHPDLYYGYFKIVGRIAGEQSHITCRLGDHEARALVKVSQQGHRVKGTTPHLRRGGFVTEIQPDDSAGPEQRAQYVDETGVIKIFTRFPGVSLYIGPSLTGVERPEGKAMLAELVGEAFCRQLARKQLETLRKTPYPGAEIDAFLKAVNELQQRHIGRIHEFILKWKT